MRYLICIMCFLAAVSSSVRADKVWDFSTNGDTQGWTAGHNVAPLSAKDGHLMGEATGFDAWINGPRYPDINADLCKYVHIRMKISAGLGGEFFWGTAAEPWSSADRTTSFYISPTNSFQDCVIDLSKNPRWKGMVNSLRIDPTWEDPAHFEIDFIKVTTTPPVILEASVPSATDRFAFAGSTFAISARIRNNGVGPATNVRATLAIENQAILSPPSQVIDSIPPHGEATVSWKARADIVRPSKMSLSVVADNALNSIKTTSVLIVSKARPQLSNRSKSTAKAWLDATGNAIIENPKVRMVFTKSSYGYGVGELYVRNGSRWDLAGASSPLSRVTYQSFNSPAGEEDSAATKTANLAITPSTASASGVPGGARMTLSYDNVDVDGVHWTGSLIYTLKDIDDAIKVNYTLAASRRRGLLAWVGPGLCPGNMSFGTAKSEAIFPGVEWLVGNEKSSNTLEMDWPACIRVVPHPYKLTTPLMAVSGNGEVVGLLWNPLQKWNGTDVCPAAKFSSPNWYEAQDNSLMELFVPSVPRWTSENSSTADVPYDLAPNGHLSMEAYYFGKRGEVLDAEREWYSLFGPAPMPGTSDQIETGLSLARTGMMKTLWDAPNRSWYWGLNDDGTPCGASGPDADAAADLLADSLQESDPATRTAMRDIANSAVQHAIAKEGPYSIGYNYRLPYFAGHMPEMLNRMKNDASALISSQQPDGGWLMTETKSPVDGRPLTNPRTKELGPCAANARQLLKIAATIGDPNILAAGVHALDYMKAFVVPRAAQTWEVPQHAPDLLAAAYAIDAYVYGYRLTGNRDYLERAKYWATAGLQFIYQWQAPDRQIMPYASIGVYGTSNFGGCWIGKPVQWNGVDYADALLHLVECDPSADAQNSMLWRKMIEGILRCASQQIVVSKFAGTEPDSLNLIYSNTTNAVYLHNFPFYGAASGFLGRWNEINRRKISMGGAPAYLSTAAKIASVKCNKNGSQCDVALRYPVSESCQMVMAGVSVPSAVYRGKQQLNKVDDVDSVDEGWSYDAGLRAVIVKETQSAQVQPISFTFSSTAEPE